MITLEQAQAQTQTATVHTQQQQELQYGRARVEAAIQLATSASKRTCLVVFENTETQVAAALDEKAAQGFTVYPPESGPMISLVARIAW